MDYAQYQGKNPLINAYMNPTSGVLGDACLWLDTVKPFLQCPHGTPTVGYVAHCRQSPNFLTKPIHKLK